MAATMVTERAVQGTGGNLNDSLHPSLNASHCLCDLIIRRTAIVNLHEQQWVPRYYACALPWSGLQGNPHKGGCPLRLQNVHVCRARGRCGRQSMRRASPTAPAPRSTPYLRQQRRERQRRREGSPPMQFLLPTTLLPAIPALPHLR